MKGRAYRVVCGDLKVIVKARWPEEAFRLAIDGFKPKDLGEFTGIGLYGEALRFHITENLLRHWGLMSDQKKATV